MQNVWLSSNSPQEAEPELCVPQMQPFFDLYCELRGMQ